MVLKTLKLLDDFPRFNYLGKVFLFDSISPDSRDGGSEHVPLGASYRIYPEPNQFGVDQFLETLRFEQRSQLEELPITFR